MIRILTDTAADITAKEAAAMGVELVALNIRFPEFPAYDAGKDVDFSEFYRLLEKAKEFPKTSQPPPEAFERVFREAKAAGDSVIGVMISSGLSGTLQSARVAMESAGFANAHLVDTRCAIMPQRILVERAVAMRDAGQPFQEIVDALEALRDRVKVYGMLPSLTYLYKGGRLPRTVALAGNLLRIRPVITARDGVIKLVGRGRGYQALLSRLEEAPGFDPAFPVYFGYTGTDETAKKMMKQAMEQFPIQRTGIFPIGGLIGAHVGPGGFAVAFVQNEI